jgi:hypothetical protein
MNLSLASFDIKGAYDGGIEPFLCGKNEDSRRSTCDE